jgi:DNA repair protein RadC
MRKSVNRDESPEGHRQRLRERFQKAGRHALADYELLELLLTYAIPRRNTKAIAKALLGQFDTLLGVFQQPRPRLMEVDRIGPQTAIFLEVIHACLTRCTEAAVDDGASVSGPEDIFAFIRLHLGPRTRECIYALYLDDARRVRHHIEVAAGTVDQVPLYPREVLAPALIHGATGLILVHNHPEGRPVPSEQDLEMTRNIEAAAASLGIELLDHLIVTRLQAYSVKTGKLL